MILSFGFGFSCVICHRLCHAATKSERAEGLVKVEVAATTSEREEGLAEVEVGSGVPKHTDSKRAQLVT